MTLAKDSKVGFTAHQTFSATEGQFKRFDGTFLIDRGALGKSKITVRIDAASIDTDNGSRDEHLRNPDFFDVKKYPHIIFKSTQIAAKAGDRVKVKGTVTVKDKTVPVSFDMKLEWGSDGAVRARGQMTLSRNKLGITYETPFYAPTLKDNVNLSMDVRLKP